MHAVKLITKFVANSITEEMKIIEYHDRFRVPVPKAEGTEYRESKQKPQKPLFGPLLRGLATMQLDGPGFEIDGHTIRWWLFRK